MSQKPSEKKNYFKKDIYCIKFDWDINRTKTIFEFGEMVVSYDKCNFIEVVGKKVYREWVHKKMWEEDKKKDKHIGKNAESLIDVMVGRQNNSLMIASIFSGK